MDHVLIIHFESAKLVEIRQQAGVKAPEFIYLELLEDAVL